MKILMTSTAISVSLSLNSASSHAHFKTAVKKSGKATLRSDGC